MRKNVCAVLVCAAAWVMPSALSGQVNHVRPAIIHSPYTAQYRIVRTQRLADGNNINGESTETITVDSQGRHITSTTETVSSADQRTRTHVFVFDPVARTHSDWTLPGQRAMVVAMPEPGANRGCSPNSLRGDAVNIGQASGRPKPTTEDLGTDTFHGIEARGRRVTTTIPAGEIGNQDPLVRTSEVWTAVDPSLARLMVRETSNDPRTGVRTRELVDFDQREPDPAVFQPPSGYEVVNKSATETTCLADPGVAPQQ